MDRPLIQRSPFSTFDGERLPGIGHNEGPPLDPGQSFRRYAWQKARAELMPKLPLEILRRRVARARQLGLAYPQYASILLGTGRDIVGFLFTCDALGLRLSRTVALPDATAAKLAEISGVERLLLAEDNPIRLAGLLAAHGFAHVARAPRAACTWPEGRATIRSALAPMKLAPDTVVMVGTRAAERTWADAARLAKFLPAEQFFRP